MGKFFSKSSIKKMIQSESESSSTESFFSSKSNNENYFNKFAGKPMKIVGLENVTPKDASIKPFNVVKFDCGMQLSTKRFFAARGLSWPVGGNANKLAYLASAIEAGESIEVTPTEVTTRPMTYADGSFVGPRDPKTGNVTKTTDEKKALLAVTYHFEEKELPAVEMIDWNKGE